MDNKLSELSKPVGHFVEWQDAETGEKEWCECSKQNGAPLYSQEYVSALLAELEKKDREIAVIAMVTNDQLNDVADHWRDTLTESQTELEEKDRRIAELEAKLATPVRLPGALIPAVHASGEPFMRPEPFGFYLNRDDVIKKLRAAGFTVEGDDA